MATPPSPSDSAIFLAGPTGSGKSAVGMALAESLGNAAIVNADAFQIYRGYETLSAAPGPEDRQRVPHHLFGELSLSETCDAARYAALAHEVIGELIERGQQPIVVGGSGLYLKALTHGLAPTPPADAELRTRLDQMPLGTLSDWYRQLDPEGAAQADLNNRRHLTRYLEISLLSGKPCSEVRQEFANPAPELAAFVIERERADLYERINARTRQMFAEGVVDEIRRLEAHSLSATAEKAIGLGEIRSLIRGEAEETDVIESIQQATRRYAKRQGTWFRREKVFQSVCLDKNDTPESAAARLQRSLPDGQAPSP